MHQTYGRLITITMLLTLLEGCASTGSKQSTRTYGTCCNVRTSRGVGTVPTECPGADKSGPLCYPFCADGYYGAGPICWQSCPAGFRDDGAYCAKPETYGRGAGYPWQVGDTLFNLDAAWRRCEQDNPQGCEQNGAIVYPKCREGFHAVGCCICSPDCPRGMADIGVSC